MQLLLTILIVAAATGYALWRTARVLRRHDSACDDCPSSHDCPSCCCGKGKD